MIQPAAKSLSSSLALGTGAHPAPGDEPANSAGFAALLTASMSPGQDVSSEAMTVAGPTIGPTARQMSGKAAGKTLPAGLPDLTALGASAESAPTASAVPAGSGETTPMMPILASKIVLPGLVLPVTGQLAETARPAAPRAPEGSTAENLANTAAAQLVRVPRSVKSNATPAPKPAKTATDSEQIASTADDEASTATMNGTSVAAASDLVPLVIPVAAQSVQPGALLIQPIATRASSKTQAKTDATRANMVPNIPITPVQNGAAQNTAAQNTAAQNTPVRSTTVRSTTVQRTPLQSTTVQGTAVQSGSIQSAALSPSPASGAAPIVVNFALSQASPEQSAVPVKLTIQQLVGHHAAAPKPMAETTAAPLVPANAQALPSATKPDAISASAEAALQPSHADAHETATSANAALAADAPQASTAAAPLPQPVLANAQPFAQTAAPITAAPAPGVAHPSSHDFTALVDRLVEAREAASPQAVHAAVSHSEFGQVSLRFDQDANGLSVSMSSADPDFARAVQASTAPAGSHTMSDNRAAPRQDTASNQQSAGSASGQPQSQAQSQDRAPQSRADAHKATRRTPEADPNDTSGDIYA